MKHRITASKTELALCCSYWARPDVELPAQEPSQSAALGSAVHRLAELYVDGESVSGAAIASEYGVSLDELHDYWEPLRKWLEEKRATIGMWSEVPLSYDTATGAVVELPKATHRDYASTSETSINGTIDLMWRDKTGANVLDIKTGRPENTTPAAQNGQLATLGLAAARYYATDTVRVGLLFVSPSGVREDWATLSVSDFGGLDDHAAALATVVQELPTAEPHPGEHCTRCYCPLRDTCPARVEIVRREEPTIAQAIEQGIRTPADVARVYRKLQVLSSMVEAAQARVREVVEQVGSVDLGDGKALRITTSKGRTTIDGAAALALAESLGATEEQLSRLVKTGKPVRSMKEGKAA